MKARDLFYSLFTSDQRLKLQGIQSCKKQIFISVLEKPWEVAELVLSPLFYQIRNTKPKWIAEGPVTSDKLTWDQSQALHFDSI